MEGRVKWFSDEKGYGFIEVADGRDVFVYYSSIIMPGHRTLKEGELVSFDLDNNPKGPAAINVLRDIDREEAEIIRLAEERVG